MNTQEHIELDFEQQIDISHNVLDEKILGLGVHISQELWENKTLDLGEFNMLKPMKISIADLKDLVSEGNILFVRCDELEENVFPCRVHFFDTTSEGVKIKFDPYKDNLHELTISRDNRSEEITYNGKSLESSLFLYPAPDVEILLEFEAYSLAATINI